MLLSTKTANQPLGILHYLGPEGSYHFLTAQTYCSEYTLQPQPDFESIFEEIDLDPTALGLVAVENSHAGDVQPNFNYILTGDYWIEAEYQLPIQHCLIVRPGVGIENIQKLYVHPQVALQCSKFIYNLIHGEVITVSSTSEGARRVAEIDPYSATIGSRQLAGHYGLEVIEASVGNVENNVTRFFRIRSRESISNPVELISGKKCAMVFTLPHTTGSLAGVLSFFAATGANLTKIESIPIENKVWEYKFYIECLIGRSFLVSSLQDIVHELQLLGMYSVQQGNSAAHP